MKNSVRKAGLQAMKFHCYKFEENAVDMFHRNFGNQLQNCTTYNPEDHSPNMFHASV
jgi:hypothetical protein